jgi:flagellar hook-basal body complex protein FliE
MRLSPISSDEGVAVEPPPVAPSGPLPTTSFGDVVAGALRDAAALERTASTKADALAAGTLDDLHGTMIAAKEAEISVHLIGTIRNKLLDAFHELWRIGV